MTEFYTLALYSLAIAASLAFLYISVRGLAQRTAAHDRYQMRGATVSRKKKNPMGLFIQAQGVKDRAALWHHLAEADYATVSVMDDFTLCMDIAEHFPDCVVVFRDSNFEPAEKGGFDWFKSWANSMLKTYGDRAKKVVLMVNCEQGHSPARFQMYADIVKHAHSIGVRVCVGNFASGTIKSGMGNDPNDWVWAEPLFKAMRDYPGSYLGIHEYTGFFAWAVSNGESPVGREAFEKAPKAINWALPQWHIGRIFGAAQAAKYLGYPMPPVIVTEGFLDDMDDIAYLYGDRKTGDVGLEIQTAGNWRQELREIAFEVFLHIGYWVIRLLNGLSRAEQYFAMYQPKKANGWQSLIPQWAKWYPGQDPGRVYARMVIWVWEVVYGPLGFVVGGHVFCYSDTGTRWAKYRVDNAPGYLDEMERWTAALNAQTPPPVEPEPEPEPETPTEPQLPFELRGEWRRRMLFHKTMKQQRMGVAVILREQANRYDAMTEEDERMEKYYRGLLEMMEEADEENA